MQELSRIRRLVIITFFLTGALGTLTGSTIYQTGPLRETKESEETILASDFEAGGVFLTQSFILSQSFSHVSIFANLTNADESKAWVSVFLTDQVGRKTTAERNEYKGGAVTVLLDGGTRDVATTLLTDLSLAAGTYFVTLSSASTDLVSIQTVLGEASAKAARGVMAGQYGTARLDKFNSDDYVPSAAFELYDYGKWPTATYLMITSELDEVPPPVSMQTPEPMSLALMTLGLAGLSWYSNNLRVQKEF